MYCSRHCPGSLDSLVDFLSHYYDLALEDEGLALLLSVLAELRRQKGQAGCSSRNTITYPERSFSQ